jgi:phosphate transport system substrate-binding protein
MVGRTVSDDMTIFTLPCRLTVRQPTHTSGSIVAVVGALALSLLSFSSMTSSSLTAADKPSSGNIIIDGSSTVYPITVAIGEQYAINNNSITIEVLCSGSSAGIRRLISGEVSVCGSSRAMKSDEMALANKNGIDIIELPIAYDGLSVVVNKRNDFIDYLTVAELKKIWQPDSTVTKWNHVRPQWPAIPIALYGPGKESGTFDYFTEAIVGKARASREDYTASEDDNDLVNGLVKNAAGGLGYFGLSYLHENSTMLRGVPIDAGSGAIHPTAETVADGSYRPLSRPLFLYASKKAVQSHKELREFLTVYLSSVETVAQNVGYVALSANAYNLVRERLANYTTGTIFDKKIAGARLVDLLEATRPSNNTTGNNSTTVVNTAPAANTAPVATVNTPKAPLSDASKNTTPPASNSEKSQPTTTAAAKNKSAATPVTPVTPVTPMVASPARITQTSPASISAPQLPNSATEPRSSAPASASVLPPAEPIISHSPTTMPVNTTRLATLSPAARARIQDETLRLARMTLNNSTTSDELQQRLNLIAQLIARETTINEPVDDFHALVARLERNSIGRTLVSDEAFTQFKNALLAVKDVQIRQAFSTSLSDPTPEKVPLFSDAITRSGAGDLQIVLCYARAGFVLR